MNCYDSSKNDYKTLEDILCKIENLNKKMDSLNKKLIEQREYFNKKMNSIEEKIKNTKIKIEKDEKFSNGKKTLFILGYIGSLTGAAIFGLNGIYKSLENFPNRPTEMWIMYIASVLLVSTWYALFHKAHYSGFYRLKSNKN